jgi:hypothetical protein
MRRQVLLLGVIFGGLGFQTLPTQEPALNAVPHYRLIQVLETSTLEEKINEAAGEGFRLVRLINAPGDTLAAIMEKVSLAS